MGGGSDGYALGYRLADVEKAEEFFSEYVAQDSCDDDGDDRHRNVAAEFFGDSEPDGCGD